MTGKQVENQKKLSISERMTHKILSEALDATSTNQNSKSFEKGSNDLINHPIE
jgi:hypothetical protein